MDRDKEVYFDQYCPKCKYWLTSESEQDSTISKCWDCLNEPSNEYSHKPVYFEETLNVKTS